MILYTLKDNGYISYAESLSENPVGKRTVYVNLTNKCNCACGFCLRSTKQFGSDDSLWIKKEPSAKEIIKQFEMYAIDQITEVVFCGFGEPTMRLEVLLEVAQYLKDRDGSTLIRINTNGLAELEYKREIAPLFEGLIDTISISLNASTAEKYYAVTKNKFGLISYKAMLAFAQKCKKYVPKVVLTVVDCIGEKEIKACQAVCDKVGIPLRVRSFE